MKTRAIIKFDEISVEYFNKLRAIEGSHFMNGVAIDNAKRNKQDDFYIFMLINEYTCLKNVKFLINVFRFLANKPTNIEDSEVPLKVLTFYKTTVKGMIKFSKRVSSINTMDKELYLSNPSDSGFIDTLNSFSIDLNKYFIQGLDSFIINEETDAYLFDIAVGIISMLDTIRILLVNGSYVGNRKNKFFIVSQQLSNWLSTTMIEINSVIKKHNAE